VLKRKKKAREICSCLACELSKLVFGFFFGVAAAAAKRQTTASAPPAVFIHPVQVFVQSSSF
jgi:hypothetical protein